MIKSFSFGVLCTVLLNVGALNAAPHNGELFDLRQPDGTLVEVRVFGDEFYQRVETPEGYTLIRDSQSQWIVFAKLSDDGNEFLSTGIRYRGPGDNPRAQKAGLSKHLQINRDVRRSIANEERQKLKPNSGPLDVSPRAPVTGDILGLTLLIDFSDRPATVPAHDIEQLMNGEGVSLYGNRSSVWEYYDEMSAGRLNYKNVVTDYYRAQHPKSYYDVADKLHSNKMAHFLVWEALFDLDQSGFDFTTLSLTDDDKIVAINVLHAGTSNQGWAQGLWPHQGFIGTFFADGVQAHAYQLSGIGSYLGIKTICHENGHMLANYKDLYDYDHDSWGIGQFCVMSGAGVPDTIPQPINGYYRYLSGWSEPIDITDAVAGTIFSIQSNTNASYIYRNVKDPLEFFFIESRYPEGHALSNPGPGLMIWHIDENQDSNNNQQMTAAYHYFVSIEQADARWHLERGINRGQADDMYFEGNVDEFSDATTPDAKWWDGSDSGLHIGNISPVAETMYFTIGASPPVTYSASGTVTGILKTASTLNYDGTFSGFVPVAPDGTFTVSGLVEGTYTLQAKSHNFYSDSAEITVGPDQTDIPLTIAMPDITVDTTPIAITVNEDEPLGSATFEITNPGTGTLTYATAVGTTNTDIVINEVFTTSSKISDGVELWNRGQNLNLGGWKLIFKDDTGASRTYTFPPTFVISAGETLVARDDTSVQEGIVKVFIGFELGWNHADNPVFSVTLVDGMGNGVDFFKSQGSTHVPPMGTNWTGAGVVLSDESSSRNSNVDNDDASDWVPTNITVNELNAGQTKVSVKEQTSWISLLPPADTINPAAKKIVTVKVDGSPFAGDTVVSDTIYVYHNDPVGDPPYEIDCEMTVEPGAAADTDTDTDTDTETDTLTDTDPDGGPAPTKNHNGCDCRTAGGDTTSPSLFRSLLKLI